MNAEASEHLRKVVLEIQDSFAVLRLNNPSNRNALSQDTLEELESALSTLLARENLKAIIFTGTDDVFASGASIRELMNLNPANALAFARRGQRLMREIINAAPLTVAAINGYCMGGGLDLALSCKVRLASSRAEFAHPGARLGIITGWGGTQILPRIIGITRALEMFTTARRLNAIEAREYGLIDFVGDPVLQLAFDTAIRLTKA
jgi:enoyl-CoA hydratase